jgi:hypothetical protein
MLSIASIVSVLGVVASNLPAAVSLGINVWDLISNSRKRIAESGGEGDELAAANKVVDDLEAAVNARVDELGRLAPNS